MGLKFLNSRGTLVVFHWGDVILLPIFGRMNVELMQRIEEIAQTICEEMSLELVELDLFQSGKKQVLRVYLWKEGGIQVGHCSKFSRELEATLDLDDLIEDAYNLEVSSPGVDRPLKSTRDFQRNIGRFIKCTLVEPIDGSQVIVGELLVAGDETLQIKIDQEEISLAREGLLNAKVEIQF